MFRSSMLSKIFSARASYTFVVILFFYFLLPQQTFATELYPASDVLGQIDEDGAVRFDSSELNSTFVNNKGLYQSMDVLIATATHKLYVADSDNNRVLVYNLNSDNTLTDYTADGIFGQPNFRTSSPGLSTTTLNTPRGLAYNSVSNTLYVSDFYNNRILAFNAANAGTSTAPTPIGIFGQVNYTTSSAVVSTSSLQNPMGMYYQARSNTLYVADYANNRILGFNANNPGTGTGSRPNAIAVFGQTTFAASSNGTSQSTLYHPTGLAYNTTSNTLYVSDEQNQRVLAFNANTPGVGAGSAPNAIGIFGQSSYNTSVIATTASSTYSPSGLAYHAASNTLFVVSAGSSRVTAFNANTPGTGAGTAPSATAIFGRRTYTDTSHNASTSSMSNPKGIALDPTNGLIYVVDNSRNRVVAFNINNPGTGNGTAPVIVNVVGSVGPNGEPTFTTNFYQNNADNNVNTYAIVSANGIELDSTNHRLFVADASNNRVLVFNLNSDNTLIDHFADGVFGQSRFTSSTAGTTQSTLNQPYGLAYDVLGDRLFVSDLGNKRVMVFNASAPSTGTTAPNAVGILGQVSYTAVDDVTISTSSLSEPYDLYYRASDNKLFVGDYMRVVIFDAANLGSGTGTRPDAVGLFGQTTYDSFSSGYESTSFSQGIASLAYNVTSNTLYVAEQSSGNRILAFDATSPGTGNGTSPAAIGLIGKTDYAFSFGGGNSSSTINNPFGMAFDDSRDLLYVAETNGYRISIFDTNNLGLGMGTRPDAIGLLGQNVVGAGDFSGVSSSTLYSPTGLAFDETYNRLYVADTRRVLLFNFISLTSTIQSTGRVNTAYSQSVDATAVKGTASYSVVSSLPSGLSLDASSGLLSGTPSAAGTYSFTIQASDTFDSLTPANDLATYTLTIAAASGGGGYSSPLPTPTPDPTPTPSSTPNPTPNLEPNKTTSTPALPDPLQRIIDEPSTVKTASTTEEITKSNITWLIQELLGKVKPNERSNNVKELQANLKKAGYFAKNFQPTNFYGTQTYSAVNKFNADQKKSATQAVKGEKIDITLDNLLKKVKPNETSQNVRNLQTRFYELGYVEKKNITGFYGPVTKAAVAKYTK